MSRAYCYSMQCRATGKPQNGGTNPRLKERVRKDATGNCPDCGQELLIERKRVVHRNRKFRE